MDATLSTKEDIMLNHKTYRDIIHLNDDTALDFEMGCHIIVQEKIDGANASFQYDCSEDRLIAFSHHQTLSPDNDLRGFYGFTQTLDKELVREVLGTKLRMFGEWLVPHTVQYPKERYDKFYCFDIFDTENGIYLPQEECHRLAEKLGLPYVPTFYEGEFSGWQHLQDYIGKTEMGGEYGEGIVVKDMTNGYYTKIVCERFRESHKGKCPKDKIRALKAKRQRNDPNRQLAATIVTRARVEKLLHKLVDEGELPENWSSTHIKQISKILPKRVYLDCAKEENDTVEQIECFGKHAAAISMELVKQISLERMGFSDTISYTSEE